LQDIFSSKESSAVQSVQGWPRSWRQLIYVGYAFYATWWTQRLWRWLTVTCDNCYVTQWTQLRTQGDTFLTAFVPSNIQTTSVEVVWAWIYCSDFSHVPFLFLDR
jgi:hypothetical protein